MPTFYQNYLAVRNTTDVTGGKPIAVGSKSISGVNAVYPLVAFYDIHGRKRVVFGDLNQNQFRYVYIHM
jgi:hypothetical protein